jgi:nucleoid-associated protein YgaU
MPLDLGSLNSSSTTSAAAQPSNTPSAFVFKEDIASGAITVSLEDTDSPHGRARELAAFESGGKVDIAQGGIYNPGSDRVVLQMMAIKENRLIIKGAFRDRIRAGAQRQVGGPEPNHAKSMRDLVERVKRRGNPLKISWDGDERTGVLEEAVYGEEGPHDIAYTITFFIATPPTGSTQAATSGTSPTPSIEDLRSQMAANHAAQMVEMEALATNAAVVATVSNALGFTANALDALGTATTTMERVVLTTPQRVDSAVNATNASAQNVQTQVQATYDAGLNSVRADDAMVNKKVDEFMKWWRWQATTSLELDQTADAMRQIRLQATAQLRLATKLYRVQEGDTLESIALTQLGSKARSSELGIRQDLLTPGAYIRIPQAV